MDSGGEKEEPNNDGVAVNVPVCPVNQSRQNGIEIVRGANCQINRVTCEVSSAQSGRSRNGEFT